MSVKRYLEIDAILDENKVSNDEFASLLKEQNILWKQLTKEEQNKILLEYSVDALIKRRK
jgi:hypothetical protein